MERSGHSEDRSRIVQEELERFRKLIKGHEKILLAIGNL